MAKKPKKDKDLEGSLFVINKKKPVEPAVDSRESVSWTVGGREVKENSKVAYARMVLLNNRHSYWLLGNARNEFYNPFSLYANEHTPTRRHHDNVIWRFVKVNKKIFDIYMEFLKTRNVARLKVAEREAY